MELLLFPLVGAAVTTAWLIGCAVHAHGRMTAIAEAAAETKALPPPRPVVTSITLSMELHPERWTEVWNVADSALIIENEVDGIKIQRAGDRFDQIVCIDPVWVQISHVDSKRILDAFERSRAWLIDTSEVES